MHDNRINNCSLTGDDLLQVDEIFGPSIEISKGRTTRNQPRILRKINELCVTYELVLRNWQDKLDSDHFFLNGLCCLHKN